MCIHKNLYREGDNKFSHWSDSVQARIWAEPTCAGHPVKAASVFMQVGRGEIYHKLLPVCSAAVVRIACFKVLSGL